MTRDFETKPFAGVRRALRPRLARERAETARRSLAHCRLCEHHCGVNRLGGERGLCGAGERARSFSAQVEVSDELELIPVFAIALSGCDLRCDFCITGRESWNPGAGRPARPETIAAQARAALEEGARTIMILGGEPTVHLPDALEIVAEMPADAFLIWKTNAHGSAAARALLDGLFDLWLADYKFGNDDCAWRLARAPRYTQVVQENLLWASRQGDLLVRHLVMPGHVECCWAPAARWLAEALPGVKINLRTGFWPAWRAARHSELCVPLSQTENELAWSLAREYGLNLIR